MLKEAIEYIINQTKKTEFYEKNNEQFSNVSLTKLEEPVRDGLQVKSLTGLVDFLKNNFDGDDKLIVQVLDETQVIVETQLNNNKARETVIIAHAGVPEKTLNSHMDLERFNVQLQSQFVSNEDSAKILRIIGNLRSENVKNVGDDGVTQSVEVRKGVTMANQEVVPNPVFLKPFRTFTEISQPESPFVFRLKEVHGEVNGALYEADGGAWKNEARLSIKQYLEEELAEKIQNDEILIIA